MKNPQFPGDEGLPSVKSMMNPAVRIETHMTAGDALRTLEQHNVPFGVVSDVDGTPLLMVTQDQLSNVKRDEQLYMFTVDVPRPAPIEPFESLDVISQTWAEKFATGDDYTDIVVQDLGNTSNRLSILPRESINGLVQNIGPNLQISSLLGDSYVGFPVGRIAGDPAITTTVNTKRKFVCHDCPRGEECPEGPDVQEIDVKSYDPDDPPKCHWHNHIMYEE